MDDARNQERLIISHRGRQAVGFDVTNRRNSSGHVRVALGDKSTSERDLTNNIYLCSFLELIKFWPLVPL